MPSGKTYSFDVHVYLDARILADLLKLYKKDKLPYPRSFPALVRETLEAARAGSVSLMDRTSTIEDAMSIFEAAGLHTAQLSMRNIKKLSVKLQHESAEPDQQTLDEVRKFLEGEDDE